MLSCVQGIFKWNGNSLQRRECSLIFIKTCGVSAKYCPVIHEYQKNNIGFNLEVCIIMKWQFKCANKDLKSLLFVQNKCPYLWKRRTILTKHILTFTHPLFVIQILRCLCVIYTSDQRCASLLRYNYKWHCEETL